MGQIFINCSWLKPRGLGTTSLVTGLPEARLSRSKTSGCHLPKGVRSPLSPPCSSSNLHVRLGRLVERFALGSPVQEDESVDSELFAGLGNSFHPSGGLGALAVLELLFSHHLSSLCDHKILLGKSALGIDFCAVPHSAHGSSLGLLGHTFRLAR